MATIVLQAAGGALGGLVGGPVGAVAGRALGALGGAALDRRLFAGANRTQGPRAQSRVLDADEGGGIPRLFGTARVTGQIIWATRFEETATTERDGGKGGRAGGSAEHTSYTYFGNFAVGLCEGPIAGIRRIWADGEEINQSRATIRLHPGTETQEADPLIEAKQGRGGAPAYRGLAYLVFDRLALERWGNRIPQISVEVLRPVGALERDVRAVCIIPGASEHGLDPLTVRERVGPGEDRLLNRHVLQADSDWTASVNELTALCPRLKRAALVVSWFADDLRVGRANVRPGVETARRDETVPWRCAGLDRSDAYVVSRVDGGPAYGGTPSDAGVVRAIQDLKRRGLAVTLYPFLLLDVPPGNAKLDPYGGGEQAAFPWRGRMTLDRAPEAAATSDRTASARTEVRRFVGAARASDFSIAAGAVRYAGPAEWSLRRMVLHQAWLARLAGGVDAFVIASEMRGLTRLRDEADRFPFVDALIELAWDVRAVLPDARITYAADWSEYFGYQPTDGSGDVFFNLDPLWADPAIDMVGIDNYLPLADTRGDERDGEGRDGFASPHDRDGLRGGLRSGEYYDWYYASDADRRLELRTPITDGLGKPWLFRAKDIRSWWSNSHHERRGGVEVAATTAWTPMMKPVWFTELGCPAIDRGANQPNVFVDPKSAESAVPHFSAGGRDDAAQRRFLEAHLAHWDPAADGFREEDNPVSLVYGGRMVEPDAIHLWCWDARPFPAFPQRADVWRDGGNWERGHWLTGRLGRAPVDRLLLDLLAGHGLRDIDVSGVDAEIGGFLLSEPGTARSEIEELLRLCDVETWSEGGTLRFRSGARSLAVHHVSAVVDNDDTPLVELRRGEAGDLPGEVLVGFGDPLRAYQPSVEAATVEQSGRQATVELPVALSPVEARGLAESLLARTRRERETASFALPPAELGVVPGDLVSLGVAGDVWQVERIEDGSTRRLTARRRRSSSAGRTGRDGTVAAAAASGPSFASRPVVHLLDLPSLAAYPEGASARAAISARPWMPYALLASPTGGSFLPRATVARRATVGTLAAPLRPGPEGRIDRAGELVVDLASGALSAVTDAALLAGANVAAVLGEGGWEILAFRDTEEIAPGRFRLGHLLRALGGTEDAGQVPVGAAFVLLDANVATLSLSAGDVGATLEWLCVPAGAPLDDPAGLRLSQRLGERALRPLSPVHLRGRFGADGGLDASWIRRSRSPVEAWDGELLLGEEAELYRVTIRAPDGPFWSGDVGAASLRLSPDEIRRAFGGSVPNGVEIEVAQLSQTAGPGTARRITVQRP